MTIRPSPTSRPGSTRPPTVVDLFCGAGGMGLGFRSAGFDILMAADSFPAAVETYRSNVGSHALELVLDGNTRLPDSSVVVGGPPCQGFSSAGLRRSGDPRNSLVGVFGRLVAEHRPLAFVFENVEGFLTGEGGRWVTDLLDPLMETGYCIHLRKINAANHGVPQHRKRVIAIGGLGWDPGFPAPSHRASGAPGAGLVRGELPWCPTVAEALRGLPPATPHPEPASLEDHDFRAPSPEDLARFDALPPGGTMKDLPEELWHETFRRRAFRRVMDGTPSERRGGAPSGFRRLDPGAPSKAVTSGAPSEFVHPLESRCLTLRECARLQTFPDDFQFRGTRTERALLIGNAVPPRLARVLASHLASMLPLAAARSAQPGVRSFVPTQSTGMSPALLETVRSLESRYGKVGNRGQPTFLFPDDEAPRAAIR